MIRLLKFFIIAVVVVLVTLWLENNPGRVELVWLGARTRMPVGLLVALVALLMLLTGLTVWGFGAIRRMPGALRRFGSERRHERGYRALTQGLVAVAAGDKEMARDLALKADRLLRDPPLTRLLSAQAAMLNGDEGAAERYFKEMLDFPETAFLGARGLLSAALKRRDYLGALAVARRAHELEPRSAWVLEHLVEAEARVGHWDEAESLVKRGLAQGLVRDHDGRSLLAGILTEHARLLAQDGRENEAAELLRQAMATEADFAPAAALLLSLPHGSDYARGFEKLVEKSFRQTGHPDIARAWMALHAVRPPTEQLGAAQRLAKWNPEAPAAHLAVAEAAIAARDLISARAAVARVPAERRRRRAWALLAAVEQASGDASSGRVTEALRKMSEAKPDPIWIDVDTEEEQRDWSLISLSGGFNRLRWRD